ncbi:MAG: hypothetical protein M3277_03385 [Actinomycetota bacterium]|nr:hypothetical protein [Actinomycetota bacterium]
MKRFLIALMLFGLIGGTLAAAEAKRPRRVERTVEGTYETQFVPYGGWVTDTCAAEATVGCVAIETRLNEAFFTARVEDAHGQPVLVTVTDVGTAQFGPSRTYGTFCGETEEPIAFDRGEDLIFSAGYWDPGLPSWPSCSPGFGTTGTISVTLSNLP